MIESKKAFSEVTSFVLLFSIIAVASTLAYTFSKNIIDEKVIEMDLTNANSFLQKANIKIAEIKNFNNAAFAINLNFKQGKYLFTNNTLYYQSLVDYTGTDYCVNNICHQSYSDNERVYITLDTPYIFKENFTLLPGNYFLTFVNIKNETKIEVKIN